MKIEMDESMKREIINKTAEMFYRTLRESSLLTEAMAMVKEKVASDIASDVAGRFHKKVNVEDIVNKAISGFEDKINARITKTIEKGIVVKLVT